MRWPCLFLLLLLSGCTSPSSDRIVLNEGLGRGAALWQLAFTLKYHRVPVVIAVHGGGSNHWTFFPDKGPLLDADSFVAGVVASHPDREVLVVSCNGGGFTLHVPHTYYAKRVVWTCPGRDYRFSESTLQMETWTGSIDEFVEGGK